MRPGPSQHRGDGRGWRRRDGWRLGWVAIVVGCVLGTSVAIAGPRDKKKPAPVDKAAEAKQLPEAPTPPALPDVAIPAPVPDAKRRMVGILDVRVDGVPDDTKAEFERGLEEQLDTNQYWLSSRHQIGERMKFSTKWTDGCLVGGCLAEVRTQTNAELVLLAAFNGSGTSFGYVVTLVRTDNGKVLSQESGRCDVCTVKEAMSEATLATIRLLNAVPDVLPDAAADQGAAIDMAVGKLARHIRTNDRRWRRRGIGITITGLVLAAGGAAVYLLGDKPDYALAIAGGGGGLAAGGILVLAF